METGLLKVNDAELYYEKRGRGPALLLISGAGGDAGYFSDMAEHLSDAFTVLNYDRRCNSRSTGPKDREMKLDEQYDDAKAIIDALAGGKAIVFGNSGGAIVGLGLAARHPGALHGLIAHEPPALRALPPTDPWYNFFDRIEARFAEAGLEVAMTEFLGTVRGANPALWKPDLAQRVSANFQFLFSKEWREWGLFEPNFKALKAAPFPIVLGAGAVDRGLYYARPSIEIAQRIGASWSEFPGDHLEFITRPEVFAAALRPIATQMYSRSVEVHELWKGSPVGPDRAA